MSKTRSDNNGEMMSTTCWTYQQHQWKVEDSGATLANFWGIMVSTLEFYTHPNYHSSLKLEKDASKYYSHKPFPWKLMKDVLRKRKRGKHGIQLKRKTYICPMIIAILGTKTVASPDRIMKIEDSKREWGGSALRPPPTPPWPPWMRISLPRHDLLGEERWPISQRRRAKSLFLNGLLLGSICTGIQVKLINHCQAVRIKHQITNKELWGLILSQGQLAKGL